MILIYSMILNVFLKIKLYLKGNDEQKPVSMAFFSILVNSFGVTKAQQK